MRLKLSRGHGLSILEVAMSLVISTLMMVAGLLLVSLFLHLSRYEEMMSQLSVVRAGVNRLYWSQPTYAGVNHTRLVEAGLIPSKWVRGDDVLNPYGGTIRLVAQPLGYAVTMTNVPKRTCVELMRSPIQAMERGRILGPDSLFPIADGAEPGTAPLEMAISLCQHDRMDVYLVFE